MIRVDSKSKVSVGSCHWGRWTCYAIVCFVGMAEEANNYWCGAPTMRCKSFSGWPGTEDGCCSMGVGTPVDSEGYACYVYCITAAGLGFGPCGPTVNAATRCNYPVDLQSVFMTEWLGTCVGTNRCSKVLVNATGQLFPIENASQVDPLSCY